MGSKRALIVGATVVTFAAALVASSPAADATAVVGTCGMTVTTSITLKNNLSCAGTALTLGDGVNSARIVVDLGGHTITTTTPAARAIFVPGVAVTLRHGTVRGAIGSEISAANTLFEHLTIDGGCVSFGNAFALVRFNRFVNGGCVVGSQVDLDVFDNQFVSGPAGATAISFDEGGLTAIGNRISGYGTGMALSDTGTTVNATDNSIRGAGRGIVVGGSGGDHVDGSLVNNTVSRSTGDGIYVGVGSNLSIDNNRVTSNGGDGIHLDRVAQHPELNILEMNDFLEGNVARNNTRWGIEAPSNSSIGPVNIFDVGFNEARGNVVGQCLNVTCTPS